MNALEYLQSIYRDELEERPVRMRAAMAALAFESPKFAVVASVNASEGMAERLMRALEAAQRVQAERAGRVIEGTTLPKVLPAPVAPGDC